MKKEENEEEKSEEVVEKIEMTEETEAVETVEAVEAEEETALTQRKAYMHELEHRAVSVLGRKVRILKTAKKKVIELAYDDDDDLEALLKTICGETFFAEID